MEKLLQINDLCIGFLVKKQLVPIIHHVSFDMEPNEVLAIIGETGCGKSVTGSAVLHLLPDNAVTSGEILYRGQDILHIRDADYRPLRGSDIMNVPQSPSTSLDPLMKIGTQVSECILGKKHPSKQTKAAVRSKAMQIFQKLSLPRWEAVYENYPCELSGGMCQRVLISMGVITHPNLLVIDEPTKAIDWSLRKDVLELLSNLKQDMHCAMLLITHDIPLARRLADRVAVMYAGEIVEIGDTEDVLTHPRHPYTRALISATPAYGFQTLKGFMPAFTDLPSGCRFRTRCPHVTDACKETVPVDTAVGSSHTIKCMCTELPDIGGLEHVRSQ